VGVFPGICLGMLLGMALMQVWSAWPGLELWRYAGAAGAQGAAPPAVPVLQDPLLLKRRAVHACECARGCVCVRFCVCVMWLCDCGCV